LRERDPEDRLREVPEREVPDREDRDREDREELAREVLARVADPLPLIPERAPS
jgi:hypothetical protein